ncbi:hypothetical protein IQ259_13970 [Fortiea sp. LEGE XX443]|uniref:hypothetical protein n=1 Tax=Fortiea sp. LEGE XX443 TaxID=1828611 RepID=UPI0018821A2F|nr:hypothetical protein [Fortiea sp. LEGE XX443]MBE9006128.1 hypothetical protein [Fortiea sp. LEGE XX443]
MLKMSNFLPLAGICATLLAGSLVSNKSLLAQNFRLANQPVNIASLANGNYQLCSQPDPKDWRDGAGVCFNFSKNGNRVNGYYGYPHSDQFICVRGIVDGDAYSNPRVERITGEGLAIVWDNLQLKNTPEPAEFKWDSEGHLTLSQGNILNTINADEDGAKWILYRKASLNLQGFYQYNRPRMTPVSQLCQWSSQ